jgi:membrane-bound lytic murein transglycosylase D
VQAQQSAEAAPVDEVPGVTGEESPELRALRLAELELFGRDQAIVELTPTLPRPLRLSAPVGMGSGASELGVRTGPSGIQLDLSWLEGLTLPDLPVRWDDRVIRYLQFFRDDPRGQQIIRSWIRRLDRFGPLIRRTLRAQGLPEDLIYVAMVESGFDPLARSDAGAVGLWQFLSRTGEEYGLRRDRWVDMRRDPEASTIAAARYLADLHRRFGTWELALAAFNMGYGALLRAIRKYDTNDYWELSHLEAALPFETSLYVAKVVACAIVGRNPEQFRLGDLTREPPIEHDVVEVPAGTGLALVARAAGVTIEELRRLNPALLRHRVPPGPEPWQLRIPAGRGEAFARAWARIRPREAAHHSYVVRFGDDLARIARRFRTSDTALRELNQIEDGERIVAGNVLLVPAVEPHEERPSEPPVVAIPPGTFEYADRRRVFYRVVQGDRLDEIARFFDVSIDEIQQWNAIDPRAVLQEGMFLQLFVPAHVDLEAAVVLAESEVRTLVIGSEEFYDWHARQEGRVRLRYCVRPGDTLSGIAARFGLTVGSLARINQIGRESVLRIGQELIVYATPDRIPRELRDRMDSSALDGLAAVESVAPAVGHEGPPPSEPSRALTGDAADVAESTARPAPPLPTDAIAPAAPSDIPSPPDLPTAS